MLSDIVGQRRPMAKIPDAADCRRALGDIAAHTSVTAAATAIVLWHRRHGTRNAPSHDRGREGQRYALESAMGHLPERFASRRRPSCAITDPACHAGRLRRWWNVKRLQWRGWQDPEESLDWLEEYREWQRRWQASEPDIPVTNDFFPFGEKKR
jgi:hypothetical protein